MAKATLALVHSRSEDFLSFRSIRAMQEIKLKETLARAFSVPFYQKRLARLGLRISQLWHLDDIGKIPFTVKDDLRRNYPWGLLAVAPEKVLRVHASSGTTGKVTLVSYTEQDLKTWAELMERIFLSSGLRPGSRVLNAYGYGLFTGGLGFEGGLRKLGALEVPISIGNYGRQIEFLHDLQIETLLCTPSSAASLLLFAHQKKLSLKNIKLKTGIFGGELWSDVLKRKIETELHLKAFDTYGLSEIIGPGVAHQCHTGEGLHLYEDHFMAEIINPETQKTLPEGVWGELVLTTLSREAMPILRYRTRDWTRMIPEPCPCGSSFRRIEKIRGRLGGPEEKIFGKRLDFYELESTLLKSEMTGLNYHIQIKPGPTPRKTQIEAQVEIKAGLKLKKTKIHTLEVELSSELHRLTGATARTHCVPAASLPLSMGKASRIEILPYG